MFESLLSTNGSRLRRARKALTLSVSLLFHAALIAAVILVPLLRAETDLPRFTIIDAVPSAPPILPGVPRGGRPGKPVKGPATIKGPQKNGHPMIGPTVLRAPYEVPTKIDEEDPTAGIPGETGGPGVEGAPVDGTGPWELGKPITVEEMNANSVPITTIRPPKLIKRVSPEYPQVPLTARIPGVVVIEARTDVYGLVKEARVISGNALFHDAALSAVRQWKYEPYYLNGIPRPVKFIVTITFSLVTR